MGNESSLTGWGTVISVGIGVLLVVVALGGVPGSEVVTTSDAPAETSTDGVMGAQEVNNTTTETNNTTTGTNNATTGTNNATNVTIPVVEAMATAQNETNGTAVGAELTREGNVTDLERPSRMYEVDILLANDTHVVADVNATDGSLRQVERQENETGVFEGLFGSEDGLPEDRPDLDSIRSGIEAVELVRNETGENGTVTAVELGTQDGQLRYTVETVSAEGIQSTVTVAANPDEGGVLTTEAGDAE